MGVRAKFVCQNATATNVNLLAVTGGSEENEKFFQYTPSGSISLNVLNPAAAEQFEVGKEYYVDFTAAGEAHQNAIVLEVGTSVIKPGGSCYKVVDIDGELQLERVKITE